jgi:hypothetical protein
MGTFRDNATRAIANSTTLGRFILEYLSFLLISLKQESILQSQGSGFAFITVNKNDAYKISNAARFGDFLSFGKGAIVQNIGNTLQLVMILVLTT